VIPLFTPDAIRELDRLAIAGGTSSSTLMERAAAGLTRAVLDVGGRGYGLRVGVVCGKGNNGGDGIAAARRLSRAGAAPRVWLAAGEHELSADCGRQLARWRGEGGRVERDLPAMLGESDVVVDCLLGTGAAGAPQPAVAAAIGAVNAAGRPVVACDIPSGVDAWTGAVSATAVRADVTVVIGAHKVGLHLWPARAHAGRLVFADIGLEAEAAPPVARVLEDRDLATLLPPGDPGADKRGRGVVLVVAGAEGMAGAALLAVRGALAGGAGLVTLAAPAAVVGAVAPAVPEAIAVTLPGDGVERARLVLEQAMRSDAVVLGPGLGTTVETGRMVRAVVAACPGPLVLDADGLNAFRGEGRALARHAAAPLVLTPHRRELARLLGEPDEAVWPGRARLVPELAARWNAVLLAKGPGTVIAAPDGRCWINGTGAPSLATGGTGDVLAGLLGALLARGGGPDVVAAGAHVHGRAGERLARGGDVGPLALAACLPGVLREIGDAVWP
jgi:hydroxyethylthiazole kinase-like uncharacterized protein yjeF